MTAHFDPLDRCPGVAGVRCETLIDAAQVEICSACRKPHLEERLSRSLEMPDQARSRRRDADADPPAHPAAMRTANGRGGPTSNQTSTYRKDER